MPVAVGALHHRRQHLRELHCSWAVVVDTGRAAIVCTFVVVVAAVAGVGQRSNSEERVGRHSPSTEDAHHREGNNWVGSAPGTAAPTGVAAVDSAGIQGVAVVAVEQVAEAASHRLFGVRARYNSVLPLAVAIEKEQRKPTVGREVHVVVVPIVA